MSAPNNVFATAVVGPGFRLQMTSTSPGNQMMPNINITFYSNPPGSGNAGCYSASSSSCSLSVNINGQVHSQTGAETIVNNRGRATRSPSFQGQYAMSGSNSVFAAAAAGSRSRRRVASISSGNPMRNVGTSSYSSTQGGNGGFTVSSSSYASSSVNGNGRVQAQSHAETIIIDRGRVTRYSVHS